MKNNFIKNHWLKISIILFTCFIIIPVMLNVFKKHEGFDISNNEIDSTTIDSTTIDDETDNTNILNMEFNPDIFSPLVENGTRLLMTDPRQQINRNLRHVFNINKDLSNNVYRKTDAAKDIYDISGNNLLTTILSHLVGLSTKIDDIKKDEPPIEDIKCIADFGTNVGDPLCCGQSGVLTDTKYVCPSNYSKCESMKCGSKYGKCVKPS